MIKDAESHRECNSKERTIIMINEKEEYSKSMSYFHRQLKEADDQPQHIKIKQVVKITLETDRNFHALRIK